MKSTEAKIITGLLKKENRLKAVEASGFIAMLKEEGKCNSDLVTDVNHYIEMLGILYRNFQDLSIAQIQKKINPIESKDFARLIKFHVEINALVDLAK